MRDLMKTEMKWAFIFIGMMLLWMVGEKLGGLHDVNIEYHPIFTNFVAIPAVLVYVFALLDKRKTHFNGFMSYKQALKTGLIITIIVTLFTPLTQYITSVMITPDYFVNVIEYSVNNKMMSREEAENYFNLKNYIIQSTLFTPVMGLLTTAIVGIFIKKEEPTN